MHSRREARTTEQSRSEASRGERRRTQDLRGERQRESGPGVDLLSQWSRMGKGKGRRRLERKLLQASATGRLSRVLHLLRKHGERQYSRKKRRRREGGGGRSSRTPDFMSPSDGEDGDDAVVGDSSSSSSHAPPSTSCKLDDHDDAHSMPESGSDRRRGVHRRRRKEGTKEEAVIREALRVIDINCRDAEGFTPLHHACCSGSQELVQFLLSEKEVDFSVQDEKGNTPLHIAARLGFAAIISLLREAGADMEAPNAEQITPMHLVYERLRKHQQQQQQQGQEEEEGFSRSSRFCGPQEWGSRLVEEKEEWSNGWTGSEQQERDADGWWQWHTDWNAADMWEDDSEGAELHQLGTKRMKKEPKDRLEGGLLKERDEKRKRALEERNREAKRILAEEEAKDRAWRERVLLRRQQDAAADANRVYEQAWKRFEQSCNLCLSFTDVPFPVEEGKEGDLARVVFHHTPLSEHKKLLRKEVLRWHPGMEFSLSLLWTLCVLALQNTLKICLPFSCPQIKCLHMV